MATVDVFILEEELDTALAITCGADIQLFRETEVDSDSYQREPPWRGSGYIAGTSPDGLVTFNGSPAVRDLALFDRDTGYLCAVTTSAPDGTYLFPGLNENRLFDVVARGEDASENDMIAARVTPHA